MEIYKDLEEALEATRRKNKRKKNKYGEGQYLCMKYRNKFKVMTKKEFKLLRGF